MVRASFSLETRSRGRFSQLYDLLWSAFSLVVFWVIGAAMFSCIEGWSFGNGVYAVMIMSLTIGQPS